MTEEILYTVKGPKTLPDMTWEELSEVLKVTDTIIVGVGSTEQHGPHLPLATDTLQTIEIVKRIVGRLAEEGITVVAGPTIPFGISPYHMPFPGTVTLRSDTLKALIMDVCKSLYQHGFRKIGLLLGHGGNLAVMQVAAQDLVLDLPDAEVVFLNDMPDLYRARAPHLPGKREGHSGANETSLILVTQPNLVQMQRAREYYSDSADRAENADHPLLGGGLFVAKRDWRKVSPFGSVGNPRLASVERGEKAYEAEVEWYVAALKRSLLKDTAPGAPVKPSEEVLYAVKGPKTLPDMTWEEVSEILKETDTVIIPVGSIEQHGPHLPLMTDTIQATEFGKRMVTGLAAEGYKVVAGPTIPFGVAPYHMPFPGTISLRSDTLKAVIMDVCTSLYQHGFRKFALVLGHGGNLAVMQVAAQDLVLELPEAEVVFLNDMPDVYRARPPAPKGKREGHSGAGETSLILTSHPNLVQMNRAREYYSLKAEEAESFDHPLLGGGLFVADKNWKAVTPYGSVGNPRLATVERGEKNYQAEVDWLVAAMKRSLLKNKAPTKGDTQ